MNITERSAAPFRDDIQVLRAIAVLYVMLYHAKIPFLKSGFLGVDVFFVISGYLIGGIIIRETHLGRFSFKSFYSRRAWRILPASYVVIFMVLIISPFFLSKAELSDLAWQAIGALTFTSNIVLWQQAGYFGGEASLKPLLHTWSLAIEEQFYLFLPVILAFTRDKVRILFVSIVTLISISLTVYLRESPSASFFLLPTRAWELLLGVIVADIVHRRSSINIPRSIYALSFVAVLGLPFIELKGFHPGPHAAVVCLATAIILASKQQKIPCVKSIGMLYVGAISYSLYLIHWPLFALYNNVTFSSPWSNKIDALMRVALIFLSFITAALLHRFVEERFRHGAHLGIKVLLPAGAAIGVLVAILFFPNIMHGASVEAREASVSKVCETTGSFSMESACASGGDPRILVWGDSYAMHLVPGLADGRSGLQVGIAHATRSGCGPFIGFARKKTERGYNQRWADSCIAFNDSVLSALSESETVEVVVISSQFSNLVENPEGIFTRSPSGRELTLQPASMDLAFQAISNTIKQLRRIGKKVVIVAPPPSGGFDMGRCGRRLVQGLPKFGVEQSCRFERGSAEARRFKTMHLLNLVAQSHNVEVIDFGELTCSNSFCESVANGIPLYVDGGHISSEGSVWIASQLDLRKRVWDLAR